MWFTETSLPPILIFGAVACAAFAVWVNRQKTRYLVAAVVCLGLCGATYALERVIVTEREVVEGRVHSLCDGFRQKNWDTLGDHFSVREQQLREAAYAAMRMVTIQGNVRVSDVRATLAAQDTRAVTHFRANAMISVEGFGQVGWRASRWNITWQKEGGSWRIIDVKRLNPINGEPMDFFDQQEM